MVKVVLRRLSRGNHQFARLFRENGSKRKSESQESSKNAAGVSSVVEEKDQKGRRRSKSIVSVSRGPCKCAAVFSACIILLYSRKLLGPRDAKLLPRNAIILELYEEGGGCDGTRAVSTGSAYIKKTSTCRLHPLTNFLLIGPRHRLPG